MYNDAIYLVDGTSICYRSFFAVKLSTSKGVPCGAVFGFFKTLQKLISKYNPSYMGVCFDVSRKTFRHEKFKEYKINRAPLPQELGTQIPLIKQMVKDLGIKVIEKEGFEADDIIATLSQKTYSKGAAVVIVSMDKDMYQLIKGKDVVVYNPGHEKIISEDDFVKEYGFKPLHMIDFLSLAGDSTDNIPGARGIGKVGAAKLVREFGAIERLFDCLDKVSPKMRNTLLDNKKEVFLSKDLVKLCMCEVDAGKDELKISKTDYPALYRLFSELEFKSLLKEIPPVSSGTEIEVKEGGEAFLNETQGEAVPIFIDKDIVYIFDNRKNCVYKNTAQELKGFLEDETRRKISYGFKEQMLSLDGIEMKGVYFDVKLAAYLIDATFSDYDLSTLSFYYLNEALPQIAAPAAAGVIWRLYEKFFVRLKEEKMEALFFEVEMPLIYVLADMQRQGVKIDIGAMNNLCKEVTARIDRVSKEIIAIAGREFNLNSHQQLADVLFKDLKIPAQGKTKTGFSTAEAALKKLADKHSVIAMILEYRQLNKLKTTYIAPLIEEVERNKGWLHASFNQTATQTGRLSSSSPNLQSIPVKGEFAASLRKAFIASAPDGVLMSADYSQIELRILAHFSQDENLLEGFRKNADIHTLTAAQLFNIETGQVSVQQRNLAKKVNFGIIYGMGQHRLSQELGITPKEAEQVINDYFLRYPKVAEYIEKVHHQLEAKGFVKTILERKRNLPHIDSSNIGMQEFSRRQAINTPIQGSCADLIKVAMVKIYNAFCEKKLKSRMIIQIHDELVFDVFGAELKEVMGLVKKHMEESIKLSVPVEVNIKAGRNWAEMEEK